MLMLRMWGVLGTGETGSLRCVLPPSENGPPLGEEEFWCEADRASVIGRGMMSES